MLRSLIALTALLFMTSSVSAQPVPGEISTRINGMNLRCSLMGGQPVRGAKPVAQPVDLTGDGRRDWVVNERAFACQPKAGDAPRPVGANVVVLVDDGRGRLVKAWEGQPPEVAVAQTRLFVVEGGQECFGSNEATLACTRELTWDAALRRMVASPFKPQPAATAATPVAPPASTASAGVPVESGEGCPSTAPVEAMAKRLEGYINSEVFCGDYDGDGRADAIAFMNFSTGGNGQNFEIAVFRNVGGTLRFVRKLEGIYGQVQLAEFAPGKIAVRMMTMRPNDARCCPSGRTRVTIDVATGRFASAALSPAPLNMITAGTYAARSCTTPRVRATYDGRSIAYGNAMASRAARPIGPITRDGHNYTLALARSGTTPAENVFIEPLSASAFLFEPGLETREGEPLSTVMRLCQPGQQAGAPSKPQSPPASGRDVTKAGFPFRQGVYTSTRSCSGNDGGLVQFMKEVRIEWEADQDTSFLRIVETAPGTYRISERFNSDEGNDEPEDVIYERLGQNGFKRTAPRTWNDAAQRWDAKPYVETYTYCRPLG